MRMVGNTLQTQHSKVDCSTFKSGDEFFMGMTKQSGVPHAHYLARPAPQMFQGVKLYLNYFQKVNMDTA
jgi:hypothetical protein